MTPTPFIYTLKGGDTLLGLAIEFGTTLQSIQDANGITDPRSLLVGQKIIIPREAVSLTGTPSPTASPLPFSVENMTFNHTPIGGLWGFGEIHNTTGTDLEQASVTIGLMDDKGKVIATAQGPAQIDLIAPDGRAPFSVHFQDAPAEFASYSAQPATGVKGYVGSYYRDLAPRNLRGEGQRYTAYTVSGTIANTGPEETVGLTVTVTVYDALGRVIGTRKAIPEHNVIPRGGETTFSVTITPAGGPVANFRVTALGRRMLTPTPPTPRLRVFAVKPLASDAPFLYRALQRFAQLVVPILALMDVVGLEHIRAQAPSSWRRIIYTFSICRSCSPTRRE